MSQGQRKLVAYLRDAGVLTNEAVENALLSADRRDFVPEQYRDKSYEDVAIPLSLESGLPTGQAVSRPSTVVVKLQLLDVNPGESVLEIGSGSGCTTVYLAHLVGPRGKVLGMEILPELAIYAKNNIRKYDIPWAEVQLAKRGIYGTPGERYDKILVSAAGLSINQDLIKQVKPDGIIVMPIQNSLLKMVRVGKTQHVSIEEYPGFSFVPLV